MLPVIRLLGLEAFPPFAPSPSSSFPHISFCLSSLFSDTLESKLQSQRPTGLKHDSAYFPRPRTCLSAPCPVQEGSSRALLSDPEAPSAVPTDILSPLTQDSVQKRTWHSVVRALIPPLEPLPSFALSPTPWYLPGADPERGAVSRGLLTSSRPRLLGRTVPATPGPFLPVASRVFTAILGVLASLPCLRLCKDSALGREASGLRQ